MSTQNTAAPPAAPAGSAAPAATAPAAPVRKTGPYGRGAGGPPSPARRSVSPELAALLSQLEQMGERLGYLAEDITCEAALLAPSASDVRAALRDLAGAELKIRQAADRVGVTLTIDGGGSGPACWATASGKPPAV